MYTNANSHIYYDIADKAVVDAFYNVTGVAPFYGIDTANERIFLPRNDWYYKTNGQVGYVPDGLPDHSHSFNTAASLTETTGGSGSTGDYVRLKNGQKTYTVTNASASNSVYGRNSRVQPPSAGAYLYFVVGNTSTITHVTTTIPSSEVLSQINKNTSDITELNDCSTFYPLYKVLHNGHSFPVNTDDAGTLYTFDLSDYLPADNSPYEVSIDIEVNNSTFVIVRAFSNVKSNYVHNELIIKGSNPIGNNNKKIVGADRQLTIGITSIQSGIDWIILRGYRKVKIG